jgi:hypothetical protein
MRTSTVVLVCILAAAEFAPGVAGEVVADGEFGFRLTIPDGFVKVPDKVQGDVLYAFMRPPAGDAKMGTVILVSRLRGVLGREKIAKQMAAKNPQIAVLEERWQEFDIEVFRVPEQVGDLKVVTFNAQVPLKPEAVQIGVFGEATRDNELRDLLQSLLSERDGETNWLTMQEREQRIAAGVTQLALCCSGAGFVTFGALVAAGLLIWRAVRKPKAKGNAGGKGSEPRQ